MTHVFALVHCDVTNAVLLQHSPKPERRGKEVSLVDFIRGTEEHEYKSL